MTVSLYRDHHPKVQRAIAHLVLLAFRGTPTCPPVARHADDDFRNLRLANLRWGRRRTPTIPPFMRIETLRAARLTWREIGVVLGFSATAVRNEFLRQTRGPALTNVDN